MEQADILVIDDEAGPRDSLRMILKNSHRVRTAANGPEGLEMIHQQKPDLVFLDIKMPGMDGVEVMRRIKAFDPDIEVALITAYAAVETAQAAVRQGALDYLSKPFAVSDVRDIVDRALERCRRRADQQAMLEQVRQISATLAGQLGELGAPPDASDQAGLLDQLTSAHGSIEDQLSNVGRLSAIGEIAAEVAHDVNNFLSAMLLRIEILLLQTQDHEQLSAEDVTATLQGIQQSVRDSVQTVERISSFSQSDPYEPDEQIQLSDILKSAADVSLGRARRREDQTMIWALQDIPEVIGNATALRTVFVNLFINAWQALEGPGEIRVSSRCDNGNVVVEISDSGCGMSPQVLERIGQPFFTTKEEGTGLGVSIAQRVIKRHGGRMVFDSTPQVGTTITVFLPVAGPQSPAQRTSQAPDVLVVDDDEAFVDAISKVLDHHGWTVSANNSGVAGLAEFEALLQENGRPPQVAIIDLRLPDLKGTDLAKRIKQLAPQVYTILVTGYLNEEPEAGVSPYFDLVISKPFNPEQLVRRVAAACAQNSDNPSDQ